MTISGALRRQTKQRGGGGASTRDQSAAGSSPTDGRCARLKGSVPTPATPVIRGFEMLLRLRTSGLNSCGKCRHTAANKAFSWLLGAAGSRGYSRAEWTLIPKLIENQNECNVEQRLLPKVGAESVLFFFQFNARRPA